MTIDEIIQIINLNTEKKLTSLQETILRQTWEGKTYTNIANDLHYKQEYIRRVASHLWTLLTKIWKIKIGKNNFRCTLEPKQLTEIERDLLKKLKSSVLIKYSSFPDHPLSVDSPLYVERPPLEALAKEEMVKPASLIRIKGPQKYGKNSLILRLFQEAQKLNYQTVTIDFKQADNSLFNDIDKLLRWLCLNIARELDINSKIEDYWNYNIGTKVSCSIYIQEGILENLEYPLVLALNEVNRLFEYPDLADDFFSLLRYWYEQGQGLKTWENLRLIVAYSTDIYIPLNLNHSPFNIGLSLNLKPFTFEQIRILVDRYGLQDLTEFDLKNLLTLLGGHPYLIQITLYKLFQSNNNQQKLFLEDIFNESLNHNSIYETYLQSIFNKLKADVKLKQAFSTIINSPNLRLQNFEKNVIKKLDDMGLILWDHDTITPSCLLFVQYFQRELNTFSSSPSSSSVSVVDPWLKKHESFNPFQGINYLSSCLDFEEILANYWQQLSIIQKPLAMIFCDQDFSEDTNNETKTEDITNKIALIISKNLRNSTDLYTLYNRHTFAIILPDADVYLAFQIAAKIRDKVKSLSPTQTTSLHPLPEQITVSLGLASLIPDPQHSPSDFMEKTQIALSEAKDNGGDQVIISSFYNHGLIDH